MSPQASARTSLLGAGSRWKLISEPLHKRSTSRRDESVAEFVRRKFGARNSRISRLAVRFRRLCRRSGKAEPASRISHARRMGTQVRQRAARRDEIAAARTTAPEPPPLCSFQAGHAAPSASARDKLGDAIATRSHRVACASSPVPQARRFEIRVTRGWARRAAAACWRHRSRHARLRRRRTCSRHCRHCSRTRFSGIAYAPVAVVAAGYYRQQIGDSLERLRLPRAAPRKASHAWHGVEFVALPRTRARRQRRDDQLCRRRHRHRNCSRSPKMKSRRSCRTRTRTCSKSAARRPCTSPSGDIREHCRNTILGHGHIVGAIRDGRNAKFQGLFFPGKLSGRALARQMRRATAFQTAEAVRKHLHNCGDGSVMLA